jgi:tetratricopeptide (TPR) repeat protein
VRFFSFLAAMALLAAPAAGAGLLEDARRARDAQDKSGLEAIAARAMAAAEKEPQNARLQYETAAAYSYLAEIATEMHDPGGARKAAETGIPMAERAVAADPKSAEYHRLLGTLYGQVIPGNLGAALRYGRKSTEELDRAVKLDPNNADVYLSRGIGKYYLPPMFGGGAEAALEDLRKAVELNPKSDQAYLWQGIVLRKIRRNREARESLTQAIQLNPQRIWARQQLEKTPAP